MAIIDPDAPVAQKELRKLEASQVIEVLRDLFGYNSNLALGFIREVREVHDPKVCDTLSIDPHGVLRYNPVFFTEHVNTERKLQEVLFHELLHPVLGDMNRRHSYIANVASDIVINVIIGRTLGHNDLMEEMYPDAVLSKMGDIAGLLRPGATVMSEGQKFLNLYHTMWGWHRRGATTSVYDPRSDGLRFQECEFGSIEEIREVLEILLSNYMGPVVRLIGSHGHTINDMGGQSIPIDPTVGHIGGTFDEISGDIKDMLADEISETISNSAGYGDTLMEMAVKTIKANVTLVRELLEDFTANSEFNSFVRYFKSRKNRRLVFPKKLSRRDAVMLGAGVTPVFWDSPKTYLNPQKDGISVFVDVSGSQWGELPMIFGFLKAVKGFTEGIYQFSNKISKTDLKDLWTKTGAKIDTTTGTDYDCIAEYCCDHDLRKVVIITDGYAGMSEENQRKCLVQVTHACVVYSEHHAESEFWKENYSRSYDIHQLFKGSK